MKKKQIRTIIIAALVLLLAVAAMLRINIEPAERPALADAITPQPVSQQTPTAAPAAGETATATERPVSPTATPETNSAPLPSQVPETEAPAATQTPETTQSPVATQIPVATQPTEPTATPAPEQAPEAPNIPEAGPLPEPVPVLPQRHVCTIEIRCDTVVDTTKLENQAVAPFVPSSGVILGTTEVEFTPGESVFDILLRATRDRNIHMEFRDDNLYSGKYIEGINYLYETDGGPLSGWMYKVNGLFPNYGCAAYLVNDGDAIVWMYTCDLGMDVGDNSTW
ncbi:MAG: DUF4430 domain-containing protein [Ruminococcaceae bacterium]|nr:DUF4430 domain-containing protein [Oscillospiraceae bacterium]